MGTLTADGKRLVTESAYVKGKSFLGSAVLLRKHGGSESVTLHLICQGVEITLKALLLIRNYDKYRPQLRKHFGHNLIKLSDAAVAEFGVHPISRGVADELGLLNKLYSNHWLRYGSIYDLLVDPRTIPAVRTLRKVTAVIRLAERVFASRARAQTDAVDCPTSPVQG